MLGSLLKKTGKEGARQDSVILAMEAVNRFLKNNEGDYPELEGLRLRWCSATTVELSDLESKNPGLLWRTAPVDAGQGALMGTYGTYTGEGFAILYEETPYGRGRYQALLASSGSECQDCGISFEADTNDKVPLAGLITPDSDAQGAERVSCSLF